METSGGLTDGPPHTLSAHQIVAAWLDDDDVDGRLQEEWTASDGSFIYRFAVADFDYLMGYLLQVSSPDGKTIDHLAVFVRHGRHPERGWNFEAEWHQHPKGRLFEPGYVAAAHHWFVDWVDSRCR